SAAVWPWVSTPRKRQSNQPGAPLCRPLGFGSGLENLPALVHAGFQVDVVGPAQFAGILVFNVGRLLQRIGRAAHPPLSRPGFSLGDGHQSHSSWLANTIVSESRAYRGSVDGALVSRYKLLHVLIGLPADSLRSPVARAPRRGRRACARPDRAAARCAAADWAGWPQASRPPLR